jgi:hypothetical protein
MTMVTVRLQRRPRVSVRHHSSFYGGCRTVLAFRAHRCRAVGMQNLWTRRRATYLVLYTL